MADPSTSEASAHRLQATILPLQDTHRQLDTLLLELIGHERRYGSALARLLGPPLTLDEVKQHVKTVKDAKARIIAVLEGAERYFAALAKGVKEEREAVSPYGQDRGAFIWGGLWVVCVVSA